MMRDATRSDETSTDMSDLAQLVVVTTRPNPIDKVEGFLRPSSAVPGDWGWDWS